MPEGPDVCVHSARDHTPAEAAEAAVQRGLQFQRDLDIRAAITAFEVRLPVNPCVICHRAYGPCSCLTQGCSSCEFSGPLQAASTEVCAC